MQIALATPIGSGRVYRSLVQTPGRNVVVLTATIAATLASCISGSDGSMEPSTTGPRTQVLPFYPVSAFPELPASPPEASLTGADDLDPVPGKLFVADWPGVSPGVDTRPADVVAWPMPSKREGRDRFEMAVDAQPDWVIVNVFLAVDPATGWPLDAATGQPTETPQQRYECRGWEGDGACAQAEDGVVSFEVPFADTDQERFVTLFAHWKGRVASTTVDGPLATVNASWMFRLQD